ncbi:thiamine phosphate synthase [Gluconobacter kanchanaburiensis]|uniref:Thiamine phosphate synthase n=1 Tax=Gluconobacter kanchanaburiensis NBRC 103587 TaxID=1307948 RepID=A0A511B620_9PROT|nr:thiamine phosphate synthase [Gluconobacter kanchanaburiensis]MBF0861512.1 thiamine phosphate synthase [Gluconobacter kanchanaburiensis]GBR68439.1 hypothetical protein AA103587_0807 [Gluconobacter kanchanaburiensis NBRC 103587]GEK95876.1 thiamine phosphate synthase [Gluconobacter kanchanaburiensis NBRC 103587]
MTACDLYPILPPRFDLTAALETLRTILPIPAVTALRFPLGWTPEKTELAAFLDVLHTNRVAMILETSGVLSGIPKSLLGICDGLHAADVEALVDLRKTVGEDLPIGCLCTNRDDAMKAGETGADYVAFPSGALDLVTWWSSVMELPAVAESIQTPEDAASALSAGADFLAIPLHCDDKDRDRFLAVSALTAG